MKLPGTFNLRDVGGYRTLDGKQTRWRTFVRAESVEKFPPESVAALIDYGVRTVMDLRGSVELDEAPNVFASSDQVAYVSHNLTGDEMIAGLSGQPVLGQGPPRLVAMYTSILDNRRQKIRQGLALLGAPGALPALVHCTAGKDRTGVITALALSIAGVPRETIAEDYALSAEFLRDPALMANAPSEWTDSFTWRSYTADFCPPEAMYQTLAYLDKRYGGVEGYLLADEFGREDLEGLRRALID